MYQEFYGLRELPFELTANPRYLYLTAGHREALSNLQYGLSSAKTATAVIGEAGTGKTTLIQAALGSDRCRNVRCVYLNNPALTRAEFIQILARNLALSADAARSKAVLLEELENRVRERRSHGEITALVVDEAQSLSTELLEEVRLLSNIEAGNEKLLPLVLVGQPSLGRRLDDPGLRQLKQRIALRCEIAPLALAETAAYIATRIQRAGGAAIHLFTREAVILIHKYSGGLPRTISVICDNALLHGLALGCRPVQQDLVLEVCRDFALRRPSNERPDEVRTSQSNGNTTEAENTDPEGDELEASERAAGAFVPHRRFRLFGARRR